MQKIEISHRPGKPKGLTKADKEAQKSDDLLVCGLAMKTDMKASLCTETVSNALKLHPELKGAIIHSDRGSQYTSDEYRRKIAIYGLKQSMNSAGERCHDNAQCESMWARMKVELFYSRKDKPENYTIEQLKSSVTI